MSGALQVRSGTTSLLSLNQDNGGNVSIAAGGGLVGIGTSSPTFKLDVAGAVRSGAGTVVANTSTGAGDFSIWSIQNNTGYGNIFLNSSARTSDGGANGMTIRNDVGPLRLQSNAAGSTGIFLSSGGNVGIGTTAPVYPLHVIGGTNLTGGSTASYFAAGGGFAVGSFPNVAVSVFANNYIVSASGMAAYSDGRIKNEIVDIVDDTALQTLRQIQPKQYKYIDKVKKGETPVWGFIAQQVKSVLDYAVFYGKDFIPNVYAIANVTMGNTLILQSGNTSELNLSSTSPTSSIKLRLYTQQDENIDVEVQEIIDSTTILLKDTIDCDSVFVYGQEVDDFHTLNKDAIYAVSVAALQEVDRQLQTEKQAHIATQQRLDILESFLKAKFPGEI